MESRGFFYYMGVSLFILFLPEACLGSVQNIGKLEPGFRGSQMTWIDNDGMFLLSSDSNFGFGFTPTEDVTLFIVSIIHMGSSTKVWSANRALPVVNSDFFVFDDTGNAYLRSEGVDVWSTNTSEKGVVSMELQNSGNLVLVGKDGSIIWQSFSHPTDTLLSNQEFRQGMKLVSNPSSNNISFILEINSGDMILYAGYHTPQPYWSMGRDSRKIINRDGGKVNLANISDNSWRFYGQNSVLLWQFVLDGDTDSNSTWVAVLGNVGYISFFNLRSGNSQDPSPTTIPKNSCMRPEPCDPYSVCYSDTDNMCRCPSVLSSRGSCGPQGNPSCNGSAHSKALVSLGDGIGYFALGFVSPSLKTDLDKCKASCENNCSCVALFFDNTSRNCFMFDRIGSFQGGVKASRMVSYVKVSSSTGLNSGVGGSSNQHVRIVIIIVFVTVLVIVCLVYLGFRYSRKKKFSDCPKEEFDEDDFLESISGMPVRFSFKDLQTATNNFSVKLGQGGFGSVYQGVLRDGTRLAVKQLEGIGQGTKEFRAEVSIIGSIHHLHLVRLKGFCAEGAHRLLVYEYMANGSLEKWIFKKNKDGFLLDWDTRYNIAVGTAKGLAYLHEDCDVKIVHCDIKPENVLLDDNYLAKVSDFGLAKLMTREQSHVFTTLRGTRGYLAPEWITNYAISEKSDVYSYGMVLLEIIGGRKNYDAKETSEKSHFPSYAFKMVEEGKMREIMDSNLKAKEEDERVCIAIKVALWCIQDDMALRPPMTKVVQMLEGLCPVPTPPTSSHMGPRLYSTFFKSMSDEGTSSGPSDCNSEAYLSAVRLSGPR